MAPKPIHKFLVLALFGILVGCQSESRNLAPPTVQYGKAVTEGAGVQIDINAEVDIVFVIDDSGSMIPHQTKLAKNIDGFVDAFAKNSIVDFHLGVLSIWDSTRYGRYDVDSNQVTSPGKVPFINRDGKQQFDQIGHLRSLKTSPGKEALLQTQPPNYVVRGSEFIDILKESLKIGVREFNRFSSETVDASGPEEEEVFSPLMAALREPVLNSVNNGFLRHRSHLVVVFLTDANDRSQISAEQVYRFLKELKGPGNFTVVGVVSPSDQKLNCRSDQSGAPKKVEELVAMSGGRILNLCADYAQELADIGKQIRDRTLKELTIRPEKIPVLETVEVKYGAKIIPPHESSGWIYDTANKTFIIRGAAEWASEPGAKLSITFEPVDPTRASSRCEGCGPSP